VDSPNLSTNHVMHALKSAFVSAQSDQNTTAIELCQWSQLGASVRAICATAIESWTCKVPQTTSTPSKSITDALGFFRSRLLAVTCNHDYIDNHLLLQNNIDELEAAAFIVVLENPLRKEQIVTGLRKKRARSALQRTSSKLRREYILREPNVTPHGFNRHGELPPDLQNLSPRADIEAWQLKALCIIWNSSFDSSHKHSDQHDQDKLTNFVCSSVKEKQFLLSRLNVSRQKCHTNV
jgi:hypothetical protein